MPDVISGTAYTIAEFGVLLGFFIIVLGAVIFLMAFFVIRILPEGIKQQQSYNETLLEQVALSRQALETSNLVIDRNTEEVRNGREFHRRLMERMDCFEVHDARAEKIAQNLAVVTALLQHQSEGSGS